MKPSVTKLIDQLDKPALTKWANKLGLQGIKLDDYKSEKKQDGTDRHLEIQTFLKYGILPDDEAFAGSLTRFFKDKEVLGCEVVIENDYFIGRYDVKFKYKDFVFVGDFKSNQKGVYLENKLQLGAYTMVEQCHACIIHLPDFIFHPVTYNQDAVNRFIICLSEIYNLRQKLEM